MVQGHFVSCDNILNTAYGAFFLLFVLLCGASSSCLSDLYLLQLQVQLFYDAEIRLNERVLSVSLRGNFEKIRIMTTFGSRVTQRGRQFEVRALQYILNVKLFNLDSKQEILLQLAIQEKKPYNNFLFRVKVVRNIFFKLNKLIERILHVSS